MQSVIAQSFFGGDVGIAGIVMFMAVMAFVFIFIAKKNLMVGFLFMIPASLIFSMLRILPDSMAMIMIVIAVIGLAKETRDYVVQ